ncbi:MAG: hypothetical protein KAT25_10615 [Sulfuriflexus sp.]|nr:hypothetical protein [Sulfuriflexus sp.]
MEIIAEPKEEEISSHSYLHLPMQSQIALMFIAVMLIFAVFASLLNSWITTNNFESELDQKATRYIQIISNEYTVHSQNIGDSDLRGNLDVIIDDKDIMSISLHDKNKSPMFLIGIDEEIPSSLFDMIENKIIQPITIDNKRYYFRDASSQSSNVDSEKLNYILLSLDSNIVFRTALNAFVWTFLLTMLAAVCIMFIAVIVIGKFTKAFNELSTAMANSQSGEHGVRVEPGGAEEIYKMGVAFNAMISVLERREDRLLTQKKVLEKEIQERKLAEQKLDNYRLHLESMVKEQTKDIEESRDAAMAGEKAMSVFLSNMSHELRTPMHGVLSFANIALRKIDSVNTEKTKEYLCEIRDSGSHLLDIINDLLDLSKMKSGKILYHHTENSFIKLIENMNREMAGLARDKRIEIDFECLGEEECFLFDEKRMMQVLRNLYANAIKFSCSDASIDIRADFRNKNSFIFSISNSGVSVPDDECEAIFDSFTQSSQTATNAGGTGLGLPISKEIVEFGHGGEIYAESGIKDGARFIVEIPNILVSEEVFQKEVKHH